MLRCRPAPQPFIVLADESLRTAVGFFIIGSLTPLFTIVHVHMSVTTHTGIALLRRSATGWE